MKKTKSLVILFSSVIVIICAAVAVMFLLPDKSKDVKVYTDKLNTGINSYNSGDYNEAIKSFEEAIKADPKGEEAYKNLGFAYIRIDRLDLAESTWRTALSETGSSEFTDLIASYLSGGSHSDESTIEAPDSSLNPGNDDSQKGKEKSSKGVNAEVMAKLAQNTYKDYTTQYGNATVKNENGVTVVTHPRFKGKFVYSKDPDGESKLGSNGMPLDGAVPDSIQLDDLSELFRGMGDKLTFDELGSFGIVGLKKQGSADNMTVTFKCQDSTITIDCDENGSISKDSKNTIVPLQKATNKEGVKRHFTVDIIMANTGKRASGEYHFDIAKKQDVRSAGNTMLGSADNVFYSVTVNNGVVDVDLANGEYVVCIYPEKDKANIKRYNWNITDSTKDADLKLTVTDRIADGKIVIVLRWADQPADLDAHLVGNGEHISYRNKVGRNARLDVDKQDGNGIETITLNNGRGDYTYYVHNFHHVPNMGRISHATVQVFTANSSTPQTFTIPANIVDVWEVFKIHDGVITPVNREGTLPN